MADNSGSQSINVLLVLILVAIIGGAFFIFGQKSRSPEGDVSRAASEVSQTIRDVADDMKGKSPAEKVGDAVKDAVK